MHKLSCSVIIPTYQREQVLCQTIREILKQSVTPDELIVVDQSEFHLPETADFLTEKAGKGLLRWIRHRPPSATVARNLGARETKSEIMLFIDDDILTHPDYLKAHLINYEDQSIAAVTGQVRAQNGKTVDRLPHQINWHDPFEVIQMPRTYNTRVDCPGLISGCNFSIRREIFQGINGFNEYFLTLSEDADLAFRLWEHGHRVVFDPDAWVIHLEYPSGGCRLSQAPAWETEWRRVVGFPYIAFRYMTDWRKNYFLWLVWLTLRSTILLKKNLGSPWKWFKAWAAAIKAISQGYRWAKLRDPLNNTGW